MLPNIGLSVQERMFEEYLNGGSLPSNLALAVRFVLWERLVRQAWDSATKAFLSGCES